jgi:biopolymer transport protein ExbB
MIDLFIKGGPLMYPLLLCSVVSLAVIIERGVQYLGSKINRSAVEEMMRLVKRGELEGALRQSRRSNGPVCAIIAEVLANRRLDRDGLEGRISQVGSGELKRLTRHLHYLELIGKIAPMIGLSGTVLGLARTFQTVASVRGFTDPSLLAGGIWEALITTVVGLFIGIPALIFYHLYDNGIRSLAHEMKSVGEELVGALEGRRDRV